MTTEETIIRNVARLLTLPQLQEQGLDVLVYGTCPDALTLTPKQEMQLKVQMGKYLRQHMRLNMDLGTVFTHLQANGLHPVLLKGQGCATYYPNPVLRATGDLDIYIGEKDYEKGKQACQTLGCKECEKETKKHIGYKYGETEIEVHRFVEPLMHPGHHRYYQKLSQEQLATPRTVSLGGVSFPIPPASFNALQCFMHIWHHFCQGGIGLRQLVDFAFILYQDHSQIDAPALQTHLKKLGRLQARQIIGCLVVDLLGLPSECYPPL